MKILVVDDHRESARACQLLLGFLGHEATVAYDGVAAVESARATLPDAVLLDIRMPGIDGYETCRQMRALPALQGVSIIAVTGVSGGDLEQRAREAGFDLVVEKPFRVRGLQQTLAALVAGRAGSAPAPR